MKAIVTIIDEETGKVVVKDKLILPSAEDMDYDTMIKSYVFTFKLQRVEMEDKNKSKLQKLKAQLSSAGDRRDWDECERLEKEIEELIEKDCGDCKYTDHKKSEPPCNSCDSIFENYVDKNKKVKIDFGIHDLTKGDKRWE